jgi:hypothetical protein
MEAVEKYCERVVGETALDITIEGLGFQNWRDALLEQANIAEGSSLEQAARPSA